MRARGSYQDVPERRTVRKRTRQELVQTLTSSGQKERASATLKHPALRRGHRISSLPVGTLAAGTIPFMRA